jgi:hypothetical protein
VSALTDLLGGALEDFTASMISRSLCRGNGGARLGHDPSAKRRLLLPYEGTPLSRVPSYGLALNLQR